MIYSADAAFDLVSKLTFFDVFNFCHFFLCNAYLKNGIFETCFRESAKRQNDRMGRPVMSCFCKDLDFAIGFATHISIFTLPSLLRLLCVINSFYRRCVSRVYNISNISSKYPIYPIIYRTYWRVTV